ncbi:MAG TPA: hypothetical protein VMJ33_00370 [Gallionella sp.]|nr:hypothetical protein [Gallionella sp.]
MKKLLKPHRLRLHPPLHPPRLLLLISLLPFLLHLRLRPLLLQTPARSKLRS